MRRTSIPAMLLAGLAACSADGPDPMEPAALNSALAPATASTIIGGTEYQYGCPDFPCPVMPIVTDHINRGLWFWMPPGTFVHPTIYLYILRTPVQLREVPRPPVILPPVILPAPPPPSLTGPVEWHGQLMPPVGQLVCRNFVLSLHSPDGGAWDFVSGEILITYVRFNPAVSNWLPTGATSRIPFSVTTWNQMLNGTFALYPPFALEEYNFRVSATVRRGTHEHVVSFTVFCTA